MGFEYKKGLRVDYADGMPFSDGIVCNIAETDQVLLGELHLPPHSKAGYDGGHPGADEVFSIRKGTAKVMFPETDESCVVNQGEYIFMPRGKPHIVHNNENTELILSFFQVVVR